MDITRSQCTTWLDVFRQMYRGVAAKHCKTGGSNRDLPAVESLQLCSCIPPYWLRGTMDLLSLCRTWPKTHLKKKWVLSNPLSHYPKQGSQRSAHSTSFWMFELDLHNAQIYLNLVKPEAVTHQPSKGTPQKLWDLVISSIAEAPVGCLTPTKI